MSDSASEQMLPTEPSKLPGWLMQVWAEALESVIDTMTGERPKVGYDLAEDGVPAAKADGWWAHSISLIPKPALWLGAASASWKELGKFTLAALGVEDASETDLQATCRDLFAQSFSALAQRLTQELGEAVTSGDVTLSNQSACESPVAFRISITAGSISIEAAALLDMAFLTRLIELSDQEEEVKDEEPSAAKADDKTAAHTEEAEPAAPPAIPNLPHVQLRVRVVLGRAKLSLREIFKLSVGSVIELDRTITDLADIMTGDHRLARGEVVVIKGNYGVRITERK